MLFRRVQYYDEERDEVLVFWTNHMRPAAATVAAVYGETHPREQLPGMKLHFRHNS